MAESPRYIKKEVPLEDLKHRPSLNIPEAMRLTGYGRDRIIQLCDEKELRWFPEGSGEKILRRRIITQSIYEYEEREAAKQLREAS